MLRLIPLVGVLVCLPQIPVDRMVEFSLDAPLETPIRIPLPGRDPSARLLAIEIARTARMPLGFEETEDVLRPRQDLPNRPRLPALTARQALDDLVRMDERYDWRQVDGVVVIRPVSAWKSSKNVLNQSIASVSWEATTEFRALCRIVELLGYGTMEPDPADKDEPRFALKVGHGTILSILDATIRSRGAFAWLVRYRDKDRDEIVRDAPVAFEIGLVGLNRGLMATDAGTTMLTFGARPSLRRP